MSTDRPAASPSAPAGAAARQLRRLVAVLVTVALGLQLLLALLLPGGPVAPLDGIRALSLPDPTGLVAVLFALSVAAELYAVRLRHGEEVEELTLAEAAMAACALVLSPLPALLLPVAASVTASVLRRRSPVKLLFNAANVAIGAALVLGGLRAVAEPGEGLTLPTTAGLVLGMSAYALTNLVSLARVLALVRRGDPAEQDLPDNDPRDVVRDGLRLSAVMTLGTTGLGATAVALAASAPVLLPFTVLPAATLTFAYRAAAQEAEERHRASVLLALSHVLADRLEGPDLVEAFLRLARQAFRADIATALLEFDDGTADCASDDRVLGCDRRPAGPRDRVLLQLAGAGAAVLPESREHAWTGALLAPLEADGRRLGALAVGTRDRHRRLGQAELSLLTPLAAALAVALRGTDSLRRLVEETSKLQAVVDRSSDGIVVLDGDGVVQLWSPAAQALTGRSTYEALGAPLSALVDATTAEGAAADAFRAGASALSHRAPQAVVELVLHRPDGEQRVVRCAHAGVFADDGALERDVLLLHDVTRERQVERLKADFIATVSHELRTPVTPIKGYADLLRRRGHTMTPERRAEFLEVISDRAAHLARLVEDLLLASRISATEGASAASVSLGSHDVVPLVRRACGDFGDDGARIALDLPGGALAARCDPVRTVQVVGNLVGNALKYSAAGTRVDVRVSVATAAVRVEVQDRGRGIPADQLGKVFDKFHRVEDPMRMTTGGTGLGLYIARQLAEAMGGQLECASTLGVGSTFGLTLPLGSSDGQPEPARAPEAVTVPRPRGRAAARRSAPQPPSALG